MRKPNPRFGSGQQETVNARKRQQKAVGVHASARVRSWRRLKAGLQLVVQERATVDCGGLGPQNQPSERNGLRAGLQDGAQLFGSEVAFRADPNGDAARGVPVARLKLLPAFTGMAGVALQRADQRQLKLFLTRKKLS